MSHISSEAAKDWIVFDGITSTHPSSCTTTTPPGLPASWSQLEAHQVAGWGVKRNGRSAFTEHNFSCLSLRVHSLALHLRKRSSPGHSQCAHSPLHAERQQPWEWGQSHHRILPSEDAPPSAWGPCHSRAGGWRCLFFHNREWGAQVDIQADPRSKNRKDLRRVWRRRRERNTECIL